MDIRDVTHLASLFCTPPLQDESRRMACFPGVGIARLHHFASAEISALAKLGNSGFLGKCSAKLKALQMAFNKYYLGLNDDPTRALAGTAALLPATSELKQGRSLMESLLYNISGWCPEFHRLDWMAEQVGYLDKAAINADGTRAIIATSETIKIWDITKEKTLGDPIPNKPQASKRLVYNDDLTVVLVGQLNVGFELINVGSGEQISIKHPFMEAIAISSDGTTALTGSKDGVAIIWDTASGRPITTLKLEDRISAVALNRNGKIGAIATVNSRKLNGWMLLDGVTGNRLSPERLTLQPTPITELSLDSDGRFVKEGRRGNYRLWEATTGNRIKFPGTSGQYGDLALSADGRIAMTSNDKQAHIWDLATSSAIGKPLEHPTSAGSLALSGNGETAVTIAGNSVFIWKSNYSKTIGAPIRHDPGFQVCLSTDGKKILTVDTRAKGSLGQCTARLWKTQTLTPFPRELNGGALGISADGKTVLAVSESDVQFLNTENGQRIGELIPARRVFGGALTKDGKMAVTVAPERGIDGFDQFKNARLWDISGKPIAILEHQDWIRKVAFSDDCNTVLIATEKSVNLWDARSGKLCDVFPSPSRQTTDVAISGDGKVIMAAWEGNSARILNKNTGKQVSLPIRFKKPVNHIVVSSNGARAVTASDNSAHIWETDTLKIIGTFDREPSRSVNRVAISANGRTAAVLLSNSELYFWQEGNWQRADVPYYAHVNNFELSNDGMIAFTENIDNTAVFWETATGKPIGFPLRFNERVHLKLMVSDNGLVGLVNSGDRMLFLRRVNVSGNPRHISLWTQVITGMELGDDDQLHALDAATWKTRKNDLDQMDGQPFPLGLQHLQELGGPPDSELPMAKIDLSKLARSAFKEIHDADEPSVQKWNASLPGLGLFPASINPAISAGVPAKLNAIATANPSNIPHRFSVWKFGPVRDKAWNELCDQGFRPYRIRHFVDEGQIAQAVLWRKDSQGHHVWFGNFEFVSGKINEARKTKWRPVELTCARISDKNSSFGCILQPDQGLRWQEHYSLSLTELSTLFEMEQARGWRPDVLSSYWDGNDVRFMAVMVENSKNIRWEFEKYKSTVAFENALSARKQSGWQPKEISSYGLGPTIQYAAIWQKE